MLIACTGWKGSGKSTVGEILEENYGFTVLRFAEPVYAALFELNPWICTSYNNKTFRRLQDLVNEEGWEQAKRRYPEIRQYLEKIGTEIGRTMISLDVWINKLDEKRSDLSPNTDVVIPDTRFVNEDWYVHSRGGRLWRVVRPNVGLEGNHSSERGQTELQIDYTINNNGDLTHLYEVVSEALVKERERVQ